MQIKATEANRVAAGVEDADLGGRWGQPIERASSHTGPKVPSVAELIQDFEISGCHSTNRMTRIGFVDPESFR